MEDDVLKARPADVGETNDALSNGNASESSQSPVEDTTEQPESREAPAAQTQIEAGGIENAKTEDGNQNDGNAAQQTSGRGASQKEHKDVNLPLTPKKSSGSNSRVSNDSPASTDFLGRRAVPELKIRNKAINVDWMTYCKNNLELLSSWVEATYSCDTSAEETSDYQNIDNAFHIIRDAFNLINQQAEDLRRVSAAESSKSAKAKIKNLEASNSSLRRDVNFYQKKLKDTEKVWHQDVQHLQGQVSYYRPFKDESQVLKNQNKLLGDNLANARAEGKKARDERDVIAVDKNQLIAELANIKRDRTKSTSLTDDEPRNDLLVPEFKQLKDQEFKGVINSVYLFSLKQDPGSKPNREQKRQRTNGYKSLLSQEIFTNGHQLFAPGGSSGASLEGEALSLSEEDHALIEKLLGSFLEILKIDREDDSSNLVLSQISTLVTQIACVGKQAEPDSRSLAGKQTEEYLDYATDRVYQNIMRSPEFANAEDIPEDLPDKIRNLVHKGLHLCQRASQADPPGQFKAYAAAEKFVSTCHEAVVGEEDEDGAVIDLTVFPAYMVGSRVFEKAQVTLTVTDKPTKDADPDDSYGDETALEEENAEENLEARKQATRQDKLHAKAKQISLNSQCDRIMRIARRKFPNKDVLFLRQELMTVNDPALLEEIMDDLALLNPNAWTMRGPLDDFHALIQNKISNRSNL